MLWRRRSPTPESGPVLESLVRRVLDQLRDSCTHWQQHQHSKCGIWPQGVPSRQPCAWVHGLYLLCWAVERGYSDPRWSTRARIEAAGVRTLQNPTGVPGLPARELDSPPSESPLPPDGPEKGWRALLNVDQADGLILQEFRDRETPSLAVYDRVEDLLQASGVGRLHEPGDRVCYQFGEDRVVLPAQDRIPGAEHDCQTVLHEFGHGAGHPPRCHHPVPISAQPAGPDSPAAYREEHRAEIGALMTGIRIGLGHRPRHGNFYAERCFHLIKSYPQELVGAAVDAWCMSEILLVGTRKLEESGAVPSSGRPGVRKKPPVRDRRGAPVTASPLRPAPGPPRPAPSADVLELFCWRGPQAERTALVYRQGGWSRRARFCAHFRCPPNQPLRSVGRLFDCRHGEEENLDALPTTTRTCRIVANSLYLALALERVSHPQVSARVRLRRLLSLDYVLDHPRLCWLPTGREKVCAFPAYCSRAATMPAAPWDAAGTSPAISPWP